MGRLAGEISRWIVASNDTDCNNPPEANVREKKIDDIALLRFNRELQIQTFPWRGRRDKPGRLSQRLPFSRHN